MRERDLRRESILSQVARKELVMAAMMTGTEMNLQRTTRMNDSDE